MSSSESSTLVGCPFRPASSARSPASMSPSSERSVKRRIATASAASPVSTATNFSSASTISTGSPRASARRTRAYSGGLLEAKSASLGGRLDERQRLGDEPDELVACFELSVDLEKGPPDVAIGGGLLAKSRVDPRRAAEIAVRTHRDFRDVEKQRAT